MGATLGAGGAIEQVKERKAQIASREKIHAPPSMILGLGTHGPLIAQEGAGDFLGQRWANAGAAAFGVEVATREEERVAQHFARETAAILPAPQAVFGVRLQALFPVRIVAGVEAGLFPRGAADDELVHRLEAPFLPGQFGSEPIKQGGVRGRLALGAEILWRSERPAEVMLPQAVGGQAHGGGVFRVGEPTGKFSARTFGGLALDGVQGLGKVGLDGVAGAAEIAANHHVCGRGFTGAHGADGECARFDFLELQVALEKRAHLVKLALAEGVELVIVALRTTNRDAEQGAADGAGHFIKDHVASLGEQIDVRHVLPRKQKPSGDGGLRIVWVQQVTGDLLLDELVVREVGIEGVDDPVAITPSVGPDLVMLKAVRLRETREVEPVLRPMLAVSGKGQQAINEFFVSIRIGVLEKRLHFRRRRRQAGEIEREPADQGAPISFRGEGEFVRPKFCGDEGIDGIRVARIIRHGRALERLPRPMIVRSGPPGGHQ